MDRAYSTFQIKAVDETSGKRVFRGMATTPSTDRSGDVVEPKGIEFKLPLPLLWQHNSREPIGWVTAAKVTDKGIEVDCEIAMVAEPGKLKDRLDEAWGMLKAKLVRGLSIGFNALESARIEGTYGMRFLKTEMLELSAVTIAANAECSITSIKSADTATRAALGLTRKGGVPLILKSPGASGNTLAAHRGAVLLIPKAKS